MLWARLIRGSSSSENAVMPCAARASRAGLPRHASLAVGIVGEVGLLARARLHDHLEAGCGELGHRIRYQGDSPLALEGLRNHPNLHSTYCPFSVPIACTALTVFTKTVKAAMQQALRSMALSPGSSHP